MPGRPKVRPAILLDKAPPIYYDEAMMNGHKITHLVQVGALCAFCGFLFANAAFAHPPTVGCTQERGGQECALAPQVHAALEALDLGVTHWAILVLDDQEWKQMVAAIVAKGRPMHSTRAFTLRDARRTYLRERAFTSRPVQELVEVLAHEFAHLRICGSSEYCAQEAGERIAKLVAAKEK